MRRSIFGAGLILSIIIFGITLGSIWGNSAETPDDVRTGFAIWQSYSCEECHTLYGQGGDYAPDLTHIYTLRGEDYIREFMVDPAAYHPNQRVMPRFTITQTDVDNVIALLRWTSNESTLGADWPPNTIQVVGGGSGFSISQTSGSETSQGRVIYSKFCASCHAIVPDVILVGPSFWGLEDRVKARFPNTQPADYIRHSILYPSDYVVDGFQDVMQKNLAEVLSSEDIDAVISFILTLKDSEGATNE